MFTVSLKCGGRSSLNNTVLSSTGSTVPDSGRCEYTICPQSDDICRIRLDFDVNTCHFIKKEAAMTVIFFVSTEICQFMRFVDPIGLVNLL